MSLEDKLYIRKLEKICIENGVCFDCGKMWRHHLDEPFASCDCKTGEDTTYASPYMKLQKRLYDVLNRNGEDNE